MLQCCLRKVDTNDEICLKGHNFTWPACQKLCSGHDIVVWHRETVDTSKFS